MVLLLSASVADSFLVGLLGPKCPAVKRPCRLDQIVQVIQSSIGEDKPAISTGPASRQPTEFPSGWPRSIWGPVPRVASRTFRQGGGSLGAFGARKPSAWSNPV